MADSHSTEVWIAVPDFDGKYEVSSQGRVRSLRFINNRVSRIRPEPFYLSVDFNHGYRRVRLVRDNKPSLSVKVSWLVLQAFVGPRPNGYHAAHLNGNRMDDSLENLAWVTPKENESHKVAHGTTNRGSRHGLSKLTEDDVRAIRTLGDSGIPNVRLADNYGVTAALISLIRKRLAWKHVK